MEKDMQCSSIILLKWRVKACEIPFQCLQLSLNPPDHSNRAIISYFGIFIMSQASSTGLAAFNPSGWWILWSRNQTDKHEEGRWFFKAQRKPSSTLILCSFPTEQAGSLPPRDHHPDHHTAPSFLLSYTAFFTALQMALPMRSSK